MIEWDGSGFSRYASLYKEELTVLMQKLAVDEDKVMTVVLDGQPVTTAHVHKNNFRATPEEKSESEENKEEEGETNKETAIEVADQLLARAKEIVPGSGQLEGLELAATTPRISEIYLWTDGVVNEPSDHFNLTDASNRRIAEEIARWRSRLKGLKGKTVTMVGVGQGVHSSLTVERAHRLFETLIEGEGTGGHLHWVQALNQIN